MPEADFRESVNSLNISTIEKSIRFSDLPVEEIILQQRDPIIHKLSHQKLHVKFWVVKLSEASGLQTIAYEHLGDFAVPRVIDRFLEDFDFKDFL